MKPPSSSSPPQAENNAADTERTLLQAARDFQQDEPSHALDLLVLRAATERTAEIREAHADTTLAAASEIQALPAAEPPPADAQKTAEAHSLLKRLSQWLFGAGEQKRPLWLAAVASVFVVAFGLVSLFGNNVRNMFASSADALMGEGMEARQLALDHRAVKNFGQGNAAAELERADLLAIAPSAPPPAANMLPDAPPEAKRAAQPVTAKPAATETAATTARKTKPEKEIETTLKRILELRRAGKKEEAQTLLQQLRERYPDEKIDKRLHKLENEENK
jgi:hypothetical protein